MLFYDLPKDYDNDILNFKNSVENFLNGKIGADNFKAVRVPFGIYEQRKKGAFMVRVRVSGGIISPEQLLKIAETSRKYGSEYLHLTTRQDIQIHNVKIENIIEILEELKKVGLSSKGGGGNTVRNIVMDHEAGFSEDEPFDITPVVKALTEDLIAEEDSYNLPRKFKISFSVNEKDNSFAKISDVGLFAKIKDGRKGFSVYVAGGLGKKARIADKLFDFIELNQLYPVVSAVKSIFFKYGNRKNRNAARLRFLYESVGKEKFLEYFNDEIKNFPPKNYELLYQSYAPEKYNKLPDFTPEVPLGDGYLYWFKNYVFRQKQEGLFSVILPVRKGDLSLEDAEKIALFGGKFGINTLRILNSQDIKLVNIPNIYLPDVYNLSVKLDSVLLLPRVITGAVGCKGSATCQLGICRPPGLLNELYKAAADRNLKYTKSLRIHVSGCQNSCGKHQIADIGLSGKAKKYDGHYYPAYVVYLNGKDSEKETIFGEKIGEIPAKVTVDFLLELLDKFEEFNSGDFSDFVKEKQAELKILIEKYTQIPSFDENAYYYYDFDSDKKFDIGDLGHGECSASFYEVIENYISIIEKSLKQIENSQNLDEAKLQDLLIKSLKILLFFKGFDIPDNKELGERFVEEYVSPGALDKKFAVISQIINSGDVSENREISLEFVNKVLWIYKNAGDNLSLNFMFNPMKKAAEANRLKDFRGVPCPMNFVKIKVELSGMKTGETLEAYLDDGPPIENVPKSLAAEGYEVLEKTKIENYWSIRILKNH